MTFNLLLFENMNMLDDYEKRFLLVYQQFLQSSESTTAQNLNKKHLLSKCLHVIIPFCAWARSSKETSNWIHETLMRGTEFRPEVRNGLCLVLAYAAAADSACNAGLTMLQVMQCGDTGLGIVHKSSLRIYNDPFDYFALMKVSQCVRSDVDISVRVTCCCGLDLSYGAN